MFVNRFVNAIPNECSGTVPVHANSGKAEGKHFNCVWVIQAKKCYRGVDRCHIPFLEKPWDIPIGKTAKDFINRKGITTINSQIIGGFSKRIYDILLSSPGSFHDGAVWAMSDARTWLETIFPQRILLGDSAYPQTDTLMTPYPEDESRYHNNNITSSSPSFIMQKSNVLEIQVWVKCLVHFYTFWQYWIGIF